MPTLSSANVPPPKGWDDFENVTLSCLRIKWSSANLTRHGRQGQPQNGVDIWGNDDLERLVGVQCRVTIGDIDSISSEAEKAEGFSPSIKAFYMATASPSDVSLQKQVRLLSQECVTKGKFPVGIFFWGDLIQELVKNRAAFRKHYPEIHLVGDKQYDKSGSRLLSLIDIAYFGLSINHKMSLIFGEFGFMAGEDPLQINIITSIVEGCAIVLMEADDFEDFASKTRALAEYAVSYARGKIDNREGWQPAIDLAIFIEKQVGKLEYGLKGRELAAFTSGRLLALWDVNATEDKKLSPTGIQRLKDAITIVSPNHIVPSEILEEISNYNESDSVGTWRIPHAVYNIVRDLILRQEME